MVGIVRRLQAGALGLLLLTEPMVAASAGVGLGLAAFATEAAAQSRSSGGYSRPRASSRTPSFGSSSAYSRRPSSSGGYGRPSSSSGSYQRRPSFGGWSSGDSAYSRRQSGSALETMRAQQEAARRQQDTSRRAADAGSSSAGGGWLDGNGGYGGGGYGGGYRSDTGRYRGADRSGWFAGRGWTAPGYAYGGRRSFGIWDGVFLWFMLDNLTRPGYGDFFRNHQDDPGYREWRAEADRLARDNADLRQKLDTLDGAVAQGRGQPRDPSYLPPDVPAEVATAAGAQARTASTADFGASLGGTWIFIAVCGGVLLLLAWTRRRTGQSRGGGAVGTLQTAGAILRHRLSGEKARPSLFRVGMTVTSDPTPFILAAGATKVPVPETGGGNLLVSVAAVGRIEDEAGGLIRLYLPDQRSLFQLHLDAAGAPDECRFLAVIDEVSPADPAEWAVWLDPGKGLIGWPEFETKDGKIYGRAWAPGAGRIEPRAIAETIETVEGTRSVSSQAMLYAAPTGLAAPAPPTEYIMVSAVEEGGSAWVEIRAGIDINPATLSLA